MAPSPSPPRDKVHRLHHRHHIGPRQVPGREPANGLGPEPRGARLAGALAFGQRTEDCLIGLRATFPVQTKRIFTRRRRPRGQIAIERAASYDIRYIAYMILAER
jgi:hypothetical protein